MRCYLCSLYWWLKGWGGFNATRAIQPDALVNLEEWLHTLLKFTPTRLMPNPSPTENGWVGAASTSFGIGILIGSQWAQFQLRHIVQDSEHKEARIALLETIEILLQ
jgi:hypothetical protein